MLASLPHGPESWEAAVAQEHPPVAKREREEE